MPSAMTSHPRLFFSPDHLARLHEPAAIPVLREAQEQLEKLSGEYAGSRRLRYNPGLHNALLSRAREMQIRVVTLLVRWLQTGDERWRAAVMDHVRDIAGWEHWCWEAEVQTPDPHRAINRLYDLSSGENSLTLALARDLLGNTLSGEELSLFVDVARRRCFEPFLTVLKSQPAPPGEWLPGWWFRRADSNWNTVCSGGAGLLALAMHDDLPELAAEVLTRVEESIRPYFERLAATGGGWVEGIGYWNYGHRYGFLYLLGWERATGRLHPCLSLPGVKETLSFPLDFAPNGQFCSFSDVNVWWPLPFHYEAAVRLGCPELIADLDRAQSPEKVAWWADAAELLLFHPRTEQGASAAFSGPVAKRYAGMDWAILADRMPEPRLYMSIRGGSTREPHAMIDVLSFHVVVGREKMIENLSNRGGDDYLETTFSSRRNDIFEIGQPAKNVLFINGVGLPEDARVEMSEVRHESAPGFRLDATRAFGFLGSNSPMADFCGRLFLLLDGKHFLIVDRFELPRAGRVEARMHTFAEVKEAPGRNGFLLSGKNEHLRVACACNVKAVTATAVACPTKPVPGAHILRWCTEARTHRNVSLVTLLSPGTAETRVDLVETPSSFQVRCRGAGWRRHLAISPHLEEITLEKA